MNTTKIFVCGDLINMFSNNSFIDEPLQGIIKDCDYSICNFEGTCEYDEIKGMDMVHLPETLPSLKNYGFKLLLLGNNHITDYGRKGLSYTINNIKKHEFDYIGAGLNYNDCYATIIKEINGIKFGFFNICEAQVGHFSSKDQKYGYAWIGDSQNDNRIRELKEKVDYLILFVHAGLENFELPLPQFRTLYHHYCDIGVDIIIGGHPHIPQGIESYNGSIIFYSLGNFFFPKSSKQDDEETWATSFSVILEFSNSAVEYSIIKHRTCNCHVSVDDNSPVDVDRLSNELLQPTYNTLINDQNIRSFNSLPYRLFREALNGAEGNDSFVFKFKHIINYLLKRRGFNKKNDRARMLLLKRLIENETYRFLTINTIDDLFREDINE